MDASAAEGGGNEHAAVPWENQYHKDIVLFVIDCGVSMHERDAGTDEVPLVTALRAAARLMEIKLVSSPHDHVGVMLWNTAESKMVTTSKSGYRPHTIEYRRIQQVDVPDTYALRELVAEAEKDPAVLNEKLAPKPSQMKVEDALTNALHLLSVSTMAGTRRAFFVTNQDNPHPGTEQKLAQKACIAKMKDYYRRGIDLEPFFMSSSKHTFVLNTFYAEIIGEYDDGVADDKMRPWRLRVLQDQNISKRKAWDSASKFAELEQQLGGREMPKRVIFDLTMDLGAVMRVGRQDGEHSPKAQPQHWRIQVKGYSLVSEVTKDMPVRVTSYGKEDPDDLHEIMVVQQLYRMGTETQLSSAQVTNAYQVSDEDSPHSRVYLSDEELGELRRFGCIPGIKLIGFKDTSTLHFWQNVRHSYFLYPSDLDHPGSKCTFAALLQSMLHKNKYALALYLPRENAVPAFVAILPQAEELDEEGNQLVPPGMNMIPLPYADDVREMPQHTYPRASEDQVEAAEKMVDSFVRTAPFNPDAFANPALHFHYSTLKAVAFGTQLPSYQDTMIPDYRLIEQRSGALIQSLNDAIASDRRTQGVPRVAHAPLKLDPERETMLKSMCDDGTIAKLSVNELKAACDHYQLNKSGRKPELIESLTAHFATGGKMHSETG